jgi:hypothetical protein
MPPICEFGETVLYMLPTAKQMPKIEAGWSPAIWLETPQQTRTSWAFPTKWSGQLKPEKYSRQLLDVINNSPMTTPTSSFIMLATTKMTTRPKTTAETQTPQRQKETSSTTTPQPSTGRIQQPAVTDAPTAAAPSTQMARAPLPLPTPKRDVADDVAEGSVQATKDVNKTDSRSKTRDNT